MRRQSQHRSDQGWTDQSACNDRINSYESVRHGSKSVRHSKTTPSPAAHLAGIVQKVYSFMQVPELLPEAPTIDMPRLAKLLNVACADTSSPLMPSFPPVRPAD